MATETHSHEHETHTHEHGGEHSHPHTYADRPHPETVLIDIGGDHGALIIHTDPGLHGVEVELSPADADDDRQHKEVLERSMGGEPAFTVVFESLLEGAYTLWVRDEARARDVEIKGAEITELDWREE